MEFLKKTLLEYSANKPSFFIIYQVGNLSTESRFWDYPERFNQTRPSYYIPTAVGTSDLTASMAAAFASASLAFQNVDRAYAQVRRPWRIPTPFVITKSALTPKSAPQILVSHAAP